ncbi:SDR family oxidoreductase [Saccharothrix obliqua]|uniref:SDR family oxidoreductase n=1 Tax=Saccharothrix obliqua TaxID=2861747 RepID=UPI001C5ECF4F|nr:NAD(P)H-binding protein [Saccharothrix obliqua]MBW4717095.1 SDR family oxidoreductase [Saccharothrix obliqua]
MRVLVTGGTGVLGGRVAARLRAAGHDTRVMSRRPGTEATADLRTGEGVRRAVADVDAVVHCATGLRGRVEVEMARNLVTAAHDTSPHLVYVSIVGVDRVPLGYYQGKLAAEQVFERSGLPVTTLRATQFHHLLSRLFDGMSRLPPAVPLPRLRVQPVDPGEVADRLVALAVAGPAGRVADFGGPAVRDTHDLVRAFLHARGRRRVVVPVPAVGRVFQALRAGGNLCPEHTDGRLTYEQHLTGAQP